MFFRCSGCTDRVAVLKGQVPKGHFFHAMCESIAGFYFFPFKSHEEDWIYVLQSLLALLGVLFKKDLQFLQFSAFHRALALLHGGILSCLAAGVSLLFVPGGFANLGRIFQGKWQF